MKKNEKAELLLELGMKEAGEKLLRKTFGKKKLLKAVENYRYATGEDLEEFNKQIRPHGKELEVVEIKDYKHIPPDHVLESLKAAKERECFDTYHVAYIRKVKDPILFGKINDFKNLYFFIDQWGDDVKIEDIIGIDD